MDRRPSPPDAVSCVLTATYTFDTQPVAERDCLLLVVGAGAIEALPRGMSMSVVFSIR